jgi:hypothetical protein
MRYLMQALSFYFRKKISFSAIRYFVGVTFMPFRARM